MAVEDRRCLSERSSPRVFWTCVAVGWGLISFGLAGLLADPRATRPPKWILWFAGSGIAHDAIIAPAAFAIGWALRRRAPTRVRRWAAIALPASAIVVAFALPEALRRHRTGNPTLLVNDYARWIVVIVASIWVVTAVAVVVRRRRRSPHVG